MKNQEEKHEEIVRLLVGIAVFLAIITASSLTTFIFEYVR